MKGRPQDAFFLKAEDVQDGQSHDDSVIGERPERVAFDKGQKGGDYHPCDDERNGESDSQRDIIFRLKQPLRFPYLIARGHDKRRERQKEGVFRCDLPIQSCEQTTDDGRS